MCDYVEFRKGEIYKAIVNERKSRTEGCANQSAFTEGQEVYCASCDLSDIHLQQEYMLRVVSVTVEAGGELEMTLEYFSVDEKYEHVNEVKLHDVFAAETLPVGSDPYTCVVNEAVAGFGEAAYESLNTRSLIKKIARDLAALRVASSEAAGVSTSAVVHPTSLSILLDRWHQEPH